MLALVSRFGLLLSITLLLGCGPQGVDFADPAFADDSALQATAVGHTSLWARPTGTLFHCVMAPCLSIRIRGVNGAPSRMVSDVDLRALDLPEEEHERLLGRLPLMLVYGRYQPMSVQGRPTVIFQVQRAFAPVGPSENERPLRDAYYRARMGNRCVDDSCVGIVADLLNQPDDELWTGIDLHRLGLSKEGEFALLLEMRFLGTLLSVEPNLPASVLPVATQAFRPVGALPISEAARP